MFSICRDENMLWQFWDFHFIAQKIHCLPIIFFSFIAHNHLHSIYLFKFNCNTPSTKTNVSFLKIFTLILKIYEKGVYILFPLGCVCRLNYLMYTILEICFYLLYTRFNDRQSYEYIITRRHVSNNRSPFKCKSSTHRHQ